MFCIELGDVRVRSDPAMASYVRGASVPAQRGAKAGEEQVGEGARVGGEAHRPSAGAAGSAVRGGRHRTGRVWGRRRREEGTRAGTEAWRPTQVTWTLSATASDR